MLEHIAYLLLNTSTYLLAGPDYMQDLKHSNR